jgi:hypothetical protein
MRRALLSLLLPLVVPAGWPHHLSLGLTDPPGDARRLVQRAQLDLRYQYLAGGVNTGRGWATWNPNGSFASNYVRESIAQNVIPVLTYYQLLGSKPAVGRGDLERDLSNLRNPSTMRAYWADYRLLLRRVVALAWHLSTWGTNEDLTYSKPSLAHVDALAAQSARFYGALGARFDLVFNDLTDRDAGFYQKLEGKPNAAWGPSDSRRHDVYTAGFARRTGTPIVLWQLPLGNSMLDNTWGHYRDNHVQWWLGDPSGQHLRATGRAGVIGLLFGGGADGTTSAETDGGLFYRLARRYERHPFALG